ncbi:tripartite tricarboxylate transporter substrate-binding protein [Xinfangfangia sp. CPCC 101601]|uniref:Tripartite tricarboxylate transporter substrate-binding protein n=1 Tax=Pseudogemmobacter lacusdianii TaxID=3069608 RepID=A0ABU0VWK6_9RHOB|nr:tripartite tricarboxylate transporter substrate-binding protein [Xinfangfangia sp. CPCC 101601]MDQ2066125.1 tripartite tricarboxylate transporter substrate-binding protein [Xinfangfangia sp. CPCC 101601]
MIRTMFTAAAALSLSGLAAFAEPAVVMAPGGAGGGYDATARLPLEAMQKDGIFTDGANYTNKGGAGGTIGLTEFVGANTGNDNAIMSMGVIMVGGILLNNSTVTLDDVTPLVRLTNDTGVIAVAPDSPIQSVDDLVAAMKADIGAVSISGGSSGGVDHITMALIAKNIGLDPAALNYIPYDSGAESVTAVGGGAVVLAVSGVSEFKPMADAGRIKIIAVTSEGRVDGIDAPSLTEAGIPVVTGNWRGIVGAGGMSDAGKAMWIDRFTKMHEGQAWKDTLALQGWEDAFLAGDDFAAFLEQEKELTAAVLKEVGLIQ